MTAAPGRTEISVNRERHVIFMCDVHACLQRPDEPLRDPVLLLLIYFIEVRSITETGAKSVAKKLQ